MKTKLALMLLSLFVVACSSKTQVHLYAKHLSVEQTAMIVKQLDETIFSVVVNQESFPNSINDNAIVYAPSANSPQRLTSLMDIISASGFTVSNASLIMANNHSFTENNVGVFLVPSGVEVEHFQTSFIEKLPTVNEYGAIDCKHATTLFLKSNDQFLIEIDIWDQAKQDYLSQYIDGTWRLSNNNVLELTHPAWQAPLMFNKSVFQKSHHGEQSKGIRFTPVKTMNPPSDIEKISCSYSISFAE